MKSNAVCCVRGLVILATLGFTSSLCGLVPSAHGQQYVFGKAEFEGGTTISSMASGDFNGDSRTDLVTANNYENTLSVMLGKPDATFQVPVAFPVGNSPRSVATGDFDNDGKLDLVVAAGNSRLVQVLIGHGDGSFEPLVDYPGPPGFANPETVLVLDLNDDSNEDLVVGFYGSNLISVYIGMGDGTFQPHMDFAADYYPTSIAAADFNGDGKVDLVTANDNNQTYSFLAGKGDGTFESAVALPMDPSFSGARAADLNQDGKADLIVVSGWSLISMLGNGDGTFSTPSVFPAGFGPSGFAIADVSNDGLLDVALGESGDGTVSLFLGKGDGTFQDRATYGVGRESGSLTMGDFNGDGVLDIAAAHDTSAINVVNTLSVLLGRGDGTFLSQEDYPAGPFPRSMQIGDLNGDQISDLVVANSGSYPDTGVTSLLGDNGGGFQTPSSISFVGQPMALAIADFNKDEKLDLAVTIFESSGSVSIHKGNGDGTFQVPTTIAAAEYPRAVAAGDFNGDGTPDLAVTAAALSTYLGTGTGTFLAPVDYSVAVQPTAITAGDFNGDGKVDLGTVSRYSQTVSIFIGSGSGTFPTRVDLQTEGYGNALNAADVNRDGHPDLLVAVDTSTEGSKIEVALGVGDGTFQAFVGYPTGGYPTSFAVGDINGDGKLDIIATQSDYVNGVSVLLGKGDGSFALPVTLATNYNPNTVLLSDFNNDGALDFATASQDGTVAVVLDSPVIAIFPTAIDFGTLKVGVTSATRGLTITNPGSMPLEISGATTSGDFAGTNDCPISPEKLAPGSNCTMSLTFTASSAGEFSGTAMIADNVGNEHQLIALSGAGVIPGASLSAASLDFEKQGINTTSAAKTVTLTNTGQAPLEIASIAVAADYTVSDDCGAALAAGDDCTISVTFAPTVVGDRPGTLTITDDALGSPRSVALSGVGTDFVLALDAGSSASATVNKGQTASYTLTLSPDTGFDQNVTFACSGAPLRSNCTVLPNPVTLDGANPVTITVSVATTAASMAGPQITPPAGIGTGARRLVLLMLLCMLMLAVGTVVSHRGGDTTSSGLHPGLRWAPLAVMLVAALFSASCGGGGSNGGGGNPGTPSGTYAITVTGTYTSGSNSLQRSIELSLKVN